MEIRRIKPSPSIEVGNLQYQIKVEENEPRHILEEIVWHKEKEVARLRERTPLTELQKTIATTPPPRNFLEAIKNPQTQPALIAEIKKASPSKGIIRADFDPVAIALDYQKAGATCLSVLTDEKFFQGSFTNLNLVRQAVDLPLLCKEFIIYPYQIYLARSQGADAILLIAAILNDRDLEYFLKIAKTLSMTALIEVHSLEELDRVLSLDGVILVGINNRNLQDFSVDLQTTCSLLAARGEILTAKGIYVVSESGLHIKADLDLVKQAGSHAVLIGESIVKQPDIPKAIANLFEV
jgi:indole-3-glycerol phosphate synthase